MDFMVGYKVGLDLADLQVSDQNAWIEFSFLDLMGKGLHRGFSQTPIWQASWVFPSWPTDPSTCCPQQPRVCKCILCAPS